MLCLGLIPISWFVFFELPESAVLCLPLFCKIPVMITSCIFFSYSTLPSPSGIQSMCMFSFELLLLFLDVLTCFLLILYFFPCKCEKFLLTYIPAPWFSPGPCLVHCWAHHRQSFCYSIWFLAFPFDSFLECLFLCLLRPTCSFHHGDLEHLVWQGQHVCHLSVLLLSLCLFRFPSLSHLTMPCNLLFKVGHDASGGRNEGEQASRMRFYAGSWGLYNICSNRHQRHQPPPGPCFGAACWLWAPLSWRTCVLQIFQLQHPALHRVPAGGWQNGRRGRALQPCN